MVGVGGWHGDRPVPFGSFAIRWPIVMCMCWVVGWLVRVDSVGGPVVDVARSSGS